MYKTREEWLNEGLLLLRKEIFIPAGHKPPAVLKVSCGFPATGAFATKKRRIGECWGPEHASRKGKNPYQLFISPTLDQPTRVLDVLAHEIVHATVGLKVGHRSPFKRVAWDIGLTGKMTATVATPELEETLVRFSKALGKYPHVALEKMTNGKKKQGTRLLKAACDCGYCIRITTKWIEEVGLPECPACGIELSLAD